MTDNVVLLRSANPSPRKTIRKVAHFQYLWGNARTYVALASSTEVFLPALSCVVIPVIISHEHAASNFFDIARATRSAPSYKRTMFPGSVLSRMKHTHTPLHTNPNTFAMCEPCSFVRIVSVLSFCPLRCFRTRPLEPHARCSVSAAPRRIQAIVSQSNI
jgi:hypothetical protein